MKLQHFIRQPWSLAKPHSPLWVSSATGIRRRDRGASATAGGGLGRGGAEPPLRGSPQAIVVLSPRVLPGRGPLCLACLHPCPVPQQPCREWRPGAGHFLGFPRAPATPQTQPGSRGRGVGADACSTFKSEVKEQLRGSSVAVCQVMRAALSQFNRQ